MTTILLFLLAQPVSTYDRDEPADSRRARIETVAQAITLASGCDKRKAAFLAVQAVAESGLRLDVQMCQCPPKQCDKGKARGLWQLHKVPEFPSVWHNVCGLDLYSQTVAANWTARYYRAQSLECSFASMGGNRVSCGVQWAVDRAKATRRLAAQL